MTQQSAQQHHRSRLPGQIDPQVVTVPLAIANLAMWLDASQLTGLSDGDAVATWTDKSGNANDATQLTSGKRALYKTGIVNGLPILRFDTSDDGYSTPLVLPNPFTIGVVYAYNGSAGARRVINGGNANFLIGPYSGAWQAHNGGFISAGTASTAWIYETFYQTSGGATFRHKGLVAGSNANAITPNPVTLGAVGPTAEEPAGSDVAEIVIYTRQLAAAEISALESYFAAKYAIS